MVIVLVGDLFTSLNFLDYINHALDFVMSTNPKLLQFVGMALNLKNQQIVNINSIFMVIPHLGDGAVCIQKQLLFDIKDKWGI